MSEEGKITAGQRFHLRDGESARPLKLAKPQSHLQSTPSPRWLLKLSIGLLIICSLIWLWQKVTDPRMLPIRKVQISGNYSHIDHAELRQVILPFSQNGFLALDVTGLHDRLQQLAWVDSVSVKRIWPDGLAITLHEQQPIARFGSDALVNTRGELFSVDAASIPAGLPLFLGAPEQQKLLLQNYQQMTAILAPLNVKIVTLALNARQSWVLQLDNGIVVLVGRVDPLQRLQRLVQVYNQIIGSKAAQVSSIDLRYTSGMAIKFKNQKVS